MVFLIRSAPGLWGETVFPSPEESPALQDVWYPWSFVINSEQHLLSIGTQLQMILSPSHKCFWLVQLLVETVCLIFSVI